MTLSPDIAAKAVSQGDRGHAHPPFREAAWYQGCLSADDYLPFFSCKAVGDVLLEAARSPSQCQILVVCGQTHSGGEAQVAENVRGVTGAAKYGKPRIDMVLQVGLGH